MSPERAHAYKRVLRTLSEVGPAKLLDGEQARIRNAADELLFSPDPDDALTAAAVSDIANLCGALVECGRWPQTSAGRLLDDVCACGPSRVLAASAA